MQISDAVQTPGHAGGNGGAASQMRAAADRLEGLFLAEMLGAAGLGEVSESFGGGEGEAQFSSFLRQAYADRLVAAGGIGLSQSIFEAMAERYDAG